MADMLWLFLSPVISMVPAFFISGFFIKSTILSLIVVVIYYFLSTTFSNLFAIVNAILWIVGAVLAILYFSIWGIILYFGAFLYLLIHHLRMNARLKKELSNENEETI